MLKYNGGGCISNRHLPPNQPTAGRVLCRLDLDSDRYPQEVEGLCKILNQICAFMRDSQQLQGGLGIGEIDINWQVLDGKG